MSNHKPPTVVASIDLHRDGQVTIDWPFNDHDEMSLDDMAAVLRAGNAADLNWENMTEGES